MLSMRRLMAVVGVALVVFFATAAVVAHYATDGERNEPVRKSPAPAARE
jgi:hypothetical protein